MATFAERIDAELVKHLISRSITDHRSGEVLDIRTAIVIRTPSGEPFEVVAPGAWADLVANGFAAKLERVGYTATNLPKES